MFFLNLQRYSNRKHFLTYFLMQLISFFLFTDWVIRSNFEIPFYGNGLFVKDVFRLSWCDIGYQREPEGIWFFVWSQLVRFLNFTKAGSSYGYDAHEKHKEYASISLWHVFGNVSKGESEDISCVIQYYFGSFSDAEHDLFLCSFTENSYRMIHL